MWLLCRNYARHCNEPRDRIYSLLSLSRKFTPETSTRAMKVDYDDITAVFQSVLEASPLQDDTIFAHTTALRRLLGIGAVSQTPRETAPADKEHYTDVASFIDGEVVRALIPESPTAKQDAALRGMMPCLIPSLVESLHYCDTYRQDWYETWHLDRHPDGDHDL
jgi:hypothetical protein